MESLFTKIEPSSRLCDALKGRKWSSFQVSGHTWYARIAPSPDEEKERKEEKEEEGEEKEEEGEAESTEE